MTNSMDALKASKMTPQAIKESTQTPEEIFTILRSATKDPREKLKALVRRPDVTDLIAKRLLESAFEGPFNHGQLNFFQTILLTLYIDKFVRHGKQRDSIRYVIMMILVWLKWMNSNLCHDAHLQPSDAKVALPHLRTMVLSLIRRYQPYQLSAATVMDEIQAVGSNTEDFDEDIYSYIGEILIDLALEGTYYQSSENLLVLAARKYFGNSDRIATVYIKSIEATFTLKDIRPFIDWKKGGTMETFLLSEDGAVAQERFQALCKHASATEVLTLLNGYVEYAGFHLSENKLYKGLSLEARADFLGPYAVQLQYATDKQAALLKVWTNDPEWSNPDRSISELTRLALKKRSIFYFNSQWVFNEIMYRLLYRVHKDEYFKLFDGATNEERRFLNALYYALEDGRYIHDEWYPKVFSPALVLMTFDRIKYHLNQKPQEDKKSNGVTGLLFRETVERLTEAFIEHVGTCLKDYNTVDACEMIHLGKGWNNETVISLLMERQDITFLQTSELLSKTKYDEFHKGLNATTGLLYAKLLQFIRATVPDEDFARLTMYTLAGHSFRWVDESYALFSVIFEREVFNDLAKLLPIMEEFVGREKITYLDFPEIYGPQKFSSSVSYWTRRFIKEHHKTKEEALVFCQHPLFAEDYEVWKWFYATYQLESLSDLQLSKLKEDSVAHIITDWQSPKIGEGLKAVWMKTPLKEISSEMMKFLMEHRYLVTLADHPDWKALSLKERLKFFTPGNKLEYSLLLQALEQDFERVWTEGKWTVDKWLKEIERINPPNPEAFATLAVSLV